MAAAEGPGQVNTCCSCTDRLLCVPDTTPVTEGGIAIIDLNPFHIGGQCESVQRRRRIAQSGCCAFRTVVSPEDQLCFLLDWPGGMIRQSFLYYGLHHTLITLNSMLTL